MNNFFTQTKQFLYRTLFVLVLSLSLMLFGGLYFWPRDSLKPEVSTPLSNAIDSLNGEMQRATREMCEMANTLAKMRGLLEQLEECK